ncbi:uncharacterized protein LOC124461767 [Drosophila willistoni]|uniref:uncharacterized protein LOC124461767 n=1 Tax=Drosophila willistoni TaxID=7260 RepID=UPI001F07A0E4|nr:uncharacterized protein LOC124461767 [Drosophila willistoni]
MFGHIGKDCPKKSEKRETEDNAVNDDKYNDENDDYNDVNDDDYSEDDDNDDYNDDNENDDYEDDDDDAESQFLHNVFPQPHRIINWYGPHGINFYRCRDCRGVHALRHCQRAEKRLRTDNVPVEKWFENFKQNAEAYKLTDKQMYVYWLTAVPLRSPKLLALYDAAFG